MANKKMQEAIQLIETTDLSRAKIAAKVGIGLATLRRWLRGTKYALGPVKAIPVTYEGVEYASIKEASCQTGAGPAKIKRVVAGIPKKQGRSIPVIFRGKVYKTIRDATKDTGACHVTIARNGTFGGEAFDALEREQVN